MTLKTILEKLSRELTDEGRLIEAGWIGMRIACVPDDANPANTSKYLSVESEDAFELARKFPI